MVSRVPCLSSFSMTHLRLLIQVLQLLNHGLPQPHGVESLSARSICFEDPGFDSDYSSSDYHDDLRRHKEIAMQF
jgi:hypothetical protein